MVWMISSMVSGWWFLWCLSLVFWLFWKFLSSMFEIIWLIIRYCVILLFLMSCYVVLLVRFCVLSCNYGLVVNVILVDGMFEIVNMCSGGIV